HRKMGLRGCTEAELAFDDVHVTPDDVLLAGDPGDSAAFRTLLAHLNHERCGNASMCIGAAQGALEHAVRYLNERTVGDRPLAELQGLQWKIADMATQLEAARLLLYRAVHMAGPRGTPPPLETAMAKAAANLAAKFVCDEAIQLLGGYRRPGGPWDVPPLDTVLSPRPVAPVRLVDGSVRLTGPDVETMVAGLAGGLRARGVRRADVVAWQLPNWHEAVLLYRACWRLGAVAAPLHSAFGEREVGAALDMLEPRLALAAPDLPVAGRAGALQVRGPEDGF